MLILARFGSVIVGAIRSKLSPKKEKKQGPPMTSINKKRQRGSFSFLGGMQVSILLFCFSSCIEGKGQEI